MREQVQDLAGPRKKGRSIEMRGGLTHRFRYRRGPLSAGAIAAAAGTIALLGITGCAKMDSALDKQWIAVNFTPNTSVAMALHVRAACSHVQNTPPMALPSTHSVTSIMYGVRFDTTNSSPANEAQLETCLQKFGSVIQGLNPEDTGDEGG